MINSWTALRNPPGNGFYRWKLYIFGADVTDYLTAASLPRTDARQPGTATFTLANENNIFVTTAADIAAMHSPSMGPPIHIENGEAVADNPYHPLKDKIINRKLGVQASVVIQGNIDGANTEGKSVIIPRWRFAAELPIFHPGDPVTFFEMDPVTLRWHWGFCGRIRIPTPERDPSGRAVVTITCVDALEALEVARVSFNPSIVDGATVAQARDLVKREWYVDGLSELSLPEYVRKMVFGYARGIEDDAALKKIQSQLANVKEGLVHKRYSVNAEKPTSEALVITAAGTYDVKNSPEPQYLGAASEGGNTDLFSWQSKLDTEVSQRDLLLRASFSKEEYTSALADVQSAKDSSGYYDQFKLVELIGSNPQRYPVDRGRILQLYPAALRGNDHSVLLKDIIQGPAMQTEFKSRFGVIYDVLQRIDHIMYATPKGDVVVEMPLIHFDADRWGAYEDRYTYSELDNAGLTQGMDTTRMVSMMTASPAVVKGHNELGFVSDVTFKPPEVATNFTLVGQFGIRMEKAPPRVFLGSKDAARAYAYSQLTRLNGEVDTAQLNIYPRMGLQPNRPMYNRNRLLVGNIKNINWNVQWGSSATMSLSMNHVRRWEGQLRSDGKVLLVPVGGIDILNEGYNWAAIMKDVSAVPANADSTTNQRMDPRMPPDALPNQSLPLDDNNVLTPGDQSIPLTKPDGTTAGGTPSRVSIRRDIPGGLTPKTQAVAHVIRDRLGYNGPMVGIGSRTTGAHGEGRALDVQVGSNEAEGDRIKTYLVENHEALGLEKVIWQGKLYSSETGWRPKQLDRLEPKGVETDPNHERHVHVSVKADSHTTRLIHDDGHPTISAGHGHTHD